MFALFVCLKQNRSGRRAGAKATYQTPCRQPWAASGRRHGLHEVPSQPQARDMTYVPGIAVGCLGARSRRLRTTTAAPATRPAGNQNRACGSAVAPLRQHLQELLLHLGQPRRQLCKRSAAREVLQVHQTPQRLPLE